MEGARQQLLDLCEITRLLSALESVEPTMLAASEVLARTLSLSGVTLFLESDAVARPQTVAWQGAVEQGFDMSQARARAEIAYGYLMGLHADLESHARKSACSILLPLAVDKCPIFGALHLESRDTLQEQDLVFVNAVANQLAIAIHREKLGRARVRSWEMARDDAEIRCALAETRRVEAEAGRVAAERTQRLVRGALAFARDVTTSLGEGVITVDLDHRITLLNPAAERLLGCAAAAALGRPIQDVIQMRRADGAPLPIGEDPFERVITRGEAIQNDDCLFECRGRARPLSVSSTCAPLRRADAVSGAVLAFRDILDIKRTEKMQRVLAEVSTMLASSLDVRETLSSLARFGVPLLADLCIIDELAEDGTVRRVEVLFADASKQRDLVSELMRCAPVHGWETPEATVLESGRSALFAKVANPAGLAHGHEHAETLRAIGIKSMVVVPIAARGKVLGALSFVAAESGRRYGSSDVQIAEEIGRRAGLAIDNARLYENAKQAARSREDVLAIVSHDLRSPLGAIFGNIDTLLESSRPDDRRSSRKQLAVIKRSAETMNDLVDELLEFASVDAGHLSIDLESVPVAPQIADALDAISVSAAKKSIRVQSDLPDALPDVVTDVVRLREVFANLLGNALKFTQEHGTVTLGARRAGSALRFSVTDTGRGIDEHDLPHIFERYWQVTRSPAFGTGLGLFIVRGIIDSLGGRVWAESKLNVGTTVFFELPIAP